MPNTDLGNTCGLGIRDTAMKDRPIPLSHLHGDEKK